MNVQVVDNFIEDQEVLDALYNYLMFRIPHNLHEGSDTINTEWNIFNKFYSADFPTDNSMIIGLYNMIMDYFGLDQNQYYILRSHVNIQYAEMGKDSNYHIDKTAITFVIFLSPNIEGGDFVFLENGISNSIKYIQNRLIKFNGDIRHKALPPSNNQPRVSLAIKIREKK